MSFHLCTVYLARDMPIMIPFDISALLSGDVLAAFGFFPLKLFPINVNPRRHLRTYPSPIKSVLQLWSIVQWVAY